MFCNSLSSFARSIRSFILPLSLAFALASNFWFSSKRSFIVTLCTFSVGRRSSPFVGTTFSAWQELPLSSSQRWSDWYRPAWLQWPSPIWRGWPPAWIAGWGYFKQGKISPKVARELLSVSFIPASKKEDILHWEYPPSLQRSQQPWQPKIFHPDKMRLCCLFLRA